MPWSFLSAKLSLAEVTPNAFSADSTIYGFDTNTILAKPAAGTHPIATGMIPDDSKYYVTNFLDSTIRVINTQTGMPIKTINLIANYNPISGAILDRWALLQFRDQLALTENT